MLWWFATGCVGGSGSTEGNNGAPAPEAADTGTSDVGPARQGSGEPAPADTGDDTAADSGAETSPADTPTVQEVTAPCREDAVTALTLGGDGALWLGCGGDRGLFRSDDGASSWEEPLVPDNAYGFRVAALLPTRDGVWSCGFDPTVDPPVLLWRLTADGALVALSRSDGAPDADELPLSTCAAVATTGDQALVLAPEGLALSVDGGVAWRVVDGAPPARIAAIGAELYTLSGDGSAPPVLAVLGGPRLPGGRAALPVALASPDGGTTLYVLGNRPDGASLARSTDAGVTWTTADLGAFTARSLAFTGNEGWIIGGALPDAPSAGTLLHSTDAGATWSSGSAELPPLTALATDTSGAWLGGPGWLGRAE